MGRETRGGTKGVQGGAASGRDPQESCHTRTTSGRGSHCWWESEQKYAPDDRSDTDAGHNKQTPSRRDSRRLGGSRNLRTLAVLLGGWGRVLDLADRLHFAFENRNIKVESRVLFGSWEKAEQFARCHDLWDQALAVRERQGRLFTPAEEEKKLVEVLPALKSAATITQVQAFRVCVHDPLKIILACMDGMPIGKAKAVLVAERKAREAGQWPHRWSAFARELMGHSEDSFVAQAERAERTRNLFRPDKRNKRNGTAEEARVAREFGGKPTPRSGAGNLKGDIVTPTARIEVKSTRGRRWLAPTYQLGQIRRTGKMPVVVLTAHGRTEFMLVDESWIDRADIKVVAIRQFERCPRTLSISRKRCDAALPGTGMAVRFDLGQYGVWLLGKPDTFAGELGDDTDEEFVTASSSMGGGHGE